MAPNVPLSRDAWKVSEKLSSEIEAGVVPLIPEVFQPHLPQQFQEPDSPNLYILQRHNTNRSTQKPITKSQTARSTLRALRIPTETQTNEQELAVLRPTRITVIEDIMRINNRNTDNTHLRPHDTASHSFPTSPFSLRGGPRITDTLHPPPPPPSSMHPGSIPMGTADDKTFGSKSNEEEQVWVGTHTHGKEIKLETTTKSPTTTIIPSRRLVPGVLKLPGHEPEAPADLVLVHHDRAIDIRNQNGLNGIYVKDDGADVTPEAATALILIGICIVFLVFICLILFIKKIRRQKLESKVKQSDGPLKPQTTYEATPSTLHHPNPLSLLPPALLHALAIATANKDEDPNFSSFFAMEQSSKGNNSLGRMWFSVYYDYVELKLVLRVMHARYTKGRGSSTNPGEVWIEACVLTSMNTVLASTKTNTRRATSAPIFNQTFKFDVRDDEVTQHLLRLTMYDRHPQNGEKAVGAVIVPLNTVDLCSEATISRDLQ